MKKLTVLFASALLALVLVAPASAAVVNQWDWTYESWFSAWSDTNPINGNSVIGSNPIGGSGTDYQTLTWGDVNDPFDSSSIYLTNFTSADTGYITTNGPSVVVSEKTHDNTSISIDHETLALGQVTAAFSLSPQDPYAPADVTSLPNVEFNFTFFETPNASSHPSDVFLLTSILGDPIGTFVYDNQMYQYSFLESFYILPDATVAYLGLPTDEGQEYYGWVTREGVDNTFQSSVTVSTVPEPSTFILLGAGLLGLVGVARRRRS